MLKLLPLFLGFVAGFVIALLLLRQAGSREKTAQRERQYQELLARYRDLSERLKKTDRTAAGRANRLRQNLLEVGEILRQKGDDSPKHVDEALKEIQSALAKEP